MSRKTCSSYRRVSELVKKLVKENLLVCTGLSQMDYLNVSDILQVSGDRYLDDLRDEMHDSDKVYSEVDDESDNIERTIESKEETRRESEDKNDEEEEVGEDDVENIEKENWDLQEVQGSSSSSEEEEEDEMKEPTG